MTLPSFGSQELNDKLRIYMASPEGGIRPEIYALDTYRSQSIQVPSWKGEVSPIDGYGIANLFWDLHQSTGVLPELDDDLLESLAHHALLSSNTWSLGDNWPEERRLLMLNASDFCRYSDPIEMVMD